MRVRYILTLIFCLWGSFCAQAQFKSGYRTELDDSETTASMREQISFLSSAMLEGRKAGSQGEKEAAIYIKSTLESYGLETLGADEEGEIFGMRLQNGDTLRSRNVIAYIPGYDKQLREEYIVVGARLDNLGSASYVVNGERREKIYYGANGNASGLSTLMHLAKLLSTQRLMLKRSVIIAAFGSSLEMGAGAWYFLNRSFQGASNIAAMVNLDMLGTGSSGFYAYTASNQDLNAVVQKLTGTLQPLQPRLVSMEPVSSDHRIFYDKEIPAIFFTTGMYPEYNSEKDSASIIEYDWMERQLEYIYNFTVELACGPRPDFRTRDERDQRYTTDDTIHSYADCDQKPAFLGSSDPNSFLKNWVHVYLRYPQSAIDAGVQGRVLVNIVLDEKGKVIETKVIKGVNEALDAEAIRVVSASPNWRPARKQGKKVKCELSFYVDFKLERNR